MATITINVTKTKAETEMCHRLIFLVQLKKFGDLQIIKELGVDVVLSYHFMPEGLDIEEIINISKEMRLYAR
jgi:hypothetical protein